MNQTYLSQIQECENSLQNAMLNSDVKLLDELLSQDLVFTNHLGNVMTKQDDLGAHSSGVLSIEKIELTDQNIKINGDVGIVTVQAEILGSFAGERAENVFRFTRVWEKAADDSWKVTVGHSCIVSQRPS